MSLKFLNTKSWHTKSSRNQKVVYETENKVKEEKERLRLRQLQIEKEHAQIQHGNEKEKQAADLKFMYQPPPGLIVNEISAAMVLPESSRRSPVCPAASLKKNRRTKDEREEQSMLWRLHDDPLVKSHRVINNSSAIVLRKNGGISPIRGDFDPSDENQQFVSMDDDALLCIDDGTERIKNVVSSLSRREKKKLLNSLRKNTQCSESDSDFNRHRRRQKKMQDRH